MYIRSIHEQDEQDVGGFIVELNVYKNELHL